MNSMKLRKEIIIIVIIVLTVLSSLTYGYSLSGYKVANKLISYKWDSFTIGITEYYYAKNAWQQASSDWPTAYSSVIVSYSANSGNTLGIEYEPELTRYGRVTYNTIGSTITTFIGQINCARSGINVGYTARSTANHEFGHLLGLDDMTYGIAIMNVNRTRTSLYTPKTDDINGVIAAYGGN